MCPVAVDDVAFFRIADASHADGQSGERRGGVAAHDVHSVLFAGQPDAGVEGFEIFDCEALADGQVDDELARGAIHGVDV